MARFKFAKGTYPQALREHNEARHKAYVAFVEEKRQRASNIITIPVGTLTGSYYLEDFSRHQLSTRTASNAGTWMNAYQQWLAGNLEPMAEFRKNHRPYFTVQGERFYWVTDYKSLKRIADTGDAYDLVFYGERQLYI